MLPKPAILLPPNTVQNGPDAIAIYHSSAARYSEKMNVTAVGLVDAVVYMSRRSGGAEYLAEILTPGEPVFVEDDTAHDGDESIERCLLSEDRWGFQVSLPSPGQRNNCTPPMSSAFAPLITEVRLGGGQVEGFVEMTEAPGAGPFVLVVLDGRTDRVSVSKSLDMHTTNGLVFFTIDKNYMKGDQSGAVAVYQATVMDFPVGSALSQIQPLDAFVFAGPGNRPSPNLTETLVPGRQPYQLSNSLREGGFHLSRCGVATWSRDPGVFWEAPQTPGQLNQCPWPKICPHSSVNPNTPGTAEDGEYIELWHPSARRVSLQGIWILLFSAHNNKPYREISLSGHFTTSKGYFLLGSDRLVPAPSLRLPPNTIQNGPDAVALYRSPFGPPSVAQRGIPTKGLLDAVVYRQRGSDRDAQELSKALTPGQLPLLEDPEVLPGDEALSRCRGLYPFDLSAFSVAPPTPLRENSCPRPPPPPEGVVISEVSSRYWTNHTQQRGFVELKGPPMTSLLGLVLSVFDQDHRGTVMALPLTGFIDQDGFYIVGNVSGADQTFPESSTVPIRGAVVLCYDLFSVCRAGTPLTNSSLRDVLVFSDRKHLLSFLSTTRGRHVIPALRSVEDGPVSLSRCSCCEVRSPLSWTSSSPTPHRDNLCPSAAFSSNIDICLSPMATDWHGYSGDCSSLLQGKRIAEVADYLEQRCHCGLSALYLQGANFSCVSGWLRVWGNIQALSDHQKALIIQTSHLNPSSSRGDACSAPTIDRYTSAASALGLQIGLVIAVFLLLGLGVALFTYFYRKRRPLDYYTMELSEHAEGLVMEKKAHYENFLDRSKLIMWQDDCYIDLQSSSSSQASQVDTEDNGWIEQHQEQFCRFLTSSFLEQILSHLKSVNLLSSCEEAKIQRADQLQDQVTTLTAIISGKGSAASNVLRDFVEKSDSQVAQLIINHDLMVQLHREVLLRRCEEHRDKLNIPSLSLLLVEGLSDLQQKEHDLMQVQAIRGAQRSSLRELSLTALLDPLTRASMPPRVSLTVGVAGVGKTTWIKHLVKLWSQGAACPDISFVLPLSFCELNSLEKLSTERLLKLAFPHLPDPSLVLSSHCRTLLILDGLDHFRGTLNFSEAAPCNDPKKEMSIDELITNIIRGNLLPHVAVWVTSRPGVASLIPGGLIDRVTEIPGFSQKDIKQFLNNFFSENDYDKMIWAHLEANKTLMSLCYIPAICWIVADTLKFVMQSGSQSHLPRTCTELFAHFCLMKAEAGEPRGREPVKTELLHVSNRKLLWSLGRLAFYALLRHKYTFSEQDLKAYGIDQSLLQCSLGTGVLIREESLISIVYRFIHLSIHEFFAAIFYYISSKRAIFDLFSESTVTWPKIGFQNHFKNAFQYSQQEVSGHFDVFVRFLSGLLNPHILKPLSALVALWKDDGSQKAWQRALYTVCCVVVALWLENNQFKDDVMELLGSILSAKDCHIKKISLADNSISNKGATSLGRALLVNRTLTSLNLRSNNIGSKGMRLLAEALKTNQVLVSVNVQNNGIEEEGAQAAAELLKCNRKLVSLKRVRKIAEALKTNRTLKKLMSCTLAEALTTNHTLLFYSKHSPPSAAVQLSDIFIVQLQSNSISNKGMTALTEALRLNHGLLSLNLRENSIGVEGAKNMAQALYRNCTLQELDLTANLLHDEGVQAIADAIKFNQSLISLNLQWNFIKSPATQALAQALLSNKTMQFWSKAKGFSSFLQENAIGNEGIVYLAESLKSNTSLQTLCLQGVSAGSPGAVALADSLITNQSLQTLDLRGNTVGIEGAKALANALKINRSLKSLNLQENCLGMDGAIFIATALKGNHQLSYINLQGNGVGESGAKVISDAIRSSAPGCVVDI
ncbi:hypothetical protein WMY93_011020 [Mugilogobius chulae]|uniref:NACHT domain-containing protein n=1 Tax=Mugilogobius chulae TaxID=88201 RepID=A0AAW0PKI2_9GOBI